MPKPHAKTAAYLAAAEASDIITDAQIVSAIEATDAKLALMAQRATVRLAALNAAAAREGEDGIRSRFEEGRQKLKAIIRLCAEMDQRTTDMLNAHRELDRHTAELKDVAVAPVDEG